MQNRRIFDLLSLEEMLMVDPDSKQTTLLQLKVDHGPERSGVGTYNNGCPVRYKFYRLDAQWMTPWLRVYPYVAKLVSTWKM
jgi:hypothetical protein